jgi:hypothetical protein
MGGVQKNLLDQRKSFIYIIFKNNVLVYLREYAINEAELKSFTVFLKTMVTFTVFKKNLFVYHLILFNRINIVWFSRRNIGDHFDPKCRFDGSAGTADCPIISLGYILDQLTTNRTALLYEVNFVLINYQFYTWSVYSRVVL